MAKEQKKEQLAFKVDPKLAARLRAATFESKRRYAPTMTAVIERGIELALKEMETDKP